MLHQPAALVDAEVDAVGGHPVLELACDARAEVAVAQGRRKEQHVRPLAFDDRAHGCDPPLGHVVAERLVLADVNELGAVARDVFDRRRDVVTEHERDIRSAELPRKLTPLREQLERGASCAAVGDLDERPAVIEGAGLLGQVLRLLPRGCPCRPLRRQLADPRGGFLDGVEALAGPLGGDIVDSKNAGRRAGLTEALVVLAHVVDEVGCGPDVDPAPSRFRLIRLALGPRNRDDRRERDLDRLLAVVRLASHAQAVALGRKSDRARHVRAAEKRRHLGRHLPGLRVERPTAAEDKVRAFLLQRQRQRPGGADRVREREGPVGEVNAPVGVERQAFAQRLLGLRRPHGHRDYLAADGLA